MEQINAVGFELTKQTLPLLIDGISLAFVRNKKLHMADFEFIQLMTMFYKALIPNADIEYMEDTVLTGRGLNMNVFEKPAVPLTMHYNPYKVKSGLKGFKYGRHYVYVNDFAEMKLKRAFVKFCEHNGLDTIIGSYDKELDNGTK